MNKLFSLFAGMTLIVIGVLGLTINFAVSVMGWDALLWPLLGLLRFWPLIIIGVGLLFTLPPLLARGKRAMGVFFIPALPILATGAILLFTSTTGWWGAWAWLWPLEVLAVAAGFVFAAIYARTVWLMIPAIIIGLNGLVLQFCAITGWWEAWSVLWTIEPLAVGLSLLMVSAVKRSTGAFIAGMIVCGLSGMAATGMFSILFLIWWPIQLMGPIALISAGVLILLLGMVQRAPQRSLA